MPRDTICDQRAGRRDDKKAAPPRARSEPSGRVNRSLDVLVAEDNKINQKFVAAVLAKDGHQTDVVENGHLAVDAVRHHDYDVILMDVQMPELDGEQATKQIRMLPSPKCDIPIIALTADAMTGTRERCIEAGMSDYLSKPVDAALLLSKLDELAAKLDRSPVKGATFAEVRMKKPPTKPPSHMAIPQIVRPLVVLSPSTEDRGVDRGQLEALRTMIAPSAFSEQLDLLLQTFMPGVERLGEHLSAGNLAESAREAHDLISVAGNFGATHVSQLARQLERACKQSESGRAADCYTELRPAAELAAATFEQVRRDADVLFLAEHR